MDIIRHGDINRLVNPMVFGCPKCGCEFIGNNTEYTTRQCDYDGEEEYVMDCPECGEKDVLYYKYPPLKPTEINSKFYYTMEYMQFDKENIGRRLALLYPALPDFNDTDGYSYSNEFNRAFREHIAKFIIGCENMTPYVVDVMRLLDLCQYGLIEDYIKLDLDKYLEPIIKEKYDRIKYLYRYDALSKRVYTKKEDYINPYQDIVNHKIDFLYVRPTPDGDYIIYTDHPLTDLPEYIKLEKDLS